MKSGARPARRATAFELKTTSADRGLRLDAVIARALPALLERSLSKSSVRRLIMAGAVHLAGLPLRRPGFELTEGAALRIEIDLDRLDAAASRSRDTSGAAGIGILYEDDDLVAVCKPAGLQVHRSADPSRDDLVSAVKRILAARAPGAGGDHHAPGRAPSPESIYLGVHQRLDVETSGCVLFTKSERANPRVAEQFETHSAGKVYHALVARPMRLPPPRWTCRAALARVGRGRRARVEAVRAGGQAAETAFEVLDTMPSALLVEARPKTGRTHQIRAHLVEAGAPILGDRRYGAPDVDGGSRVTRVMLHAIRLTLTHPVTGGTLVIECPYPKDFRNALEALKRAAPEDGRARSRSR